MDGGPNGVHLTWFQVLFGRPWILLGIYGPDHLYSGPGGPTIPKTELCLVTTCL